jgi:hypothetical protein
MAAEWHVASNEIIWRQHHGAGSSKSGKMKSGMACGRRQHQRNENMSIVAQRNGVINMKISAAKYRVMANGVKANGENGECEEMASESVINEKLKSGENNGVMAIMAK